MRVVRWLWAQCSQTCVRLYKKSFTEIDRRMRSWWRSTSPPRFGSETQLLKTFGRRTVYAAQTVWIQKVRCKSFGAGEKTVSFSQRFAIYFVLERISKRELITAKLPYEFVSRIGVFFFILKMFSRVRNPIPRTVLTKNSPDVQTHPDKIAVRTSTNSPESAGTYRNYYT